MKLTKLEIGLAALTLIFAGLLNVEVDANNVIHDLQAEHIEMEQKLRHDMSQTLLEFYTNDYCEGESRPILFKGFHVEFDALYCDRPAILLLMDDLPIAILHNTEN